MVKRRVARAVVSSFQDTLTKFGNLEQAVAQDAGVEDHQGHKMGEQSENLLLDQFKVSKK